MGRGVNLTFEDLTIRTSYLKRIGNKDLTKQMARFGSNIRTTSNSVYNKFQSTFERCGLNMDDVHSLSKLYSVYYFEIYSATVEDDEIKQRNALITFIRQRTQYLAKKCEAQAENFNISKNMSGYYAKTAKSLDAPDDVIIGNPDHWGYRKVYDSELKQLKEKSRFKMVDKDGFEIVYLKFFDNITPDEYENCLYKESTSFKSPEDLLIDMQEKYKAEQLINEFESQNVVDKIRQLKEMKSKTKSPQKKKNITKLIQMLEIENG
jgi:hypothetical protein